MSAPAQLDRWWDGLRAAALIGTSRREPPWPVALGVPSPADTPRDQQLLAAAALGGTARRAGRRPDHHAGPEPVATATESFASGAAVQLLELLVHQRPLGEDGRTLLLRHWVTTAEARAVVLPHRLLPAVLELATRRPELRPELGRVLGARGRWLAGLNPAWSWVSRRPTGDPAPSVSMLRRLDPAAGRALVESTWATDAARVRAAALSELTVGLSAADQDLLERALGDRSAEVRAVALRLLDRLPESARAVRLAERLRPLVSRHGVLRTTLEIDLPDQPDPAGVRDGLTAPTAGRSARAWWLHRIVAGAPLSVWPELARTDPTGVARLTRPNETVRAALIEAAVGRADVDWCRALLTAGWAPQLAATLPPAEQQAAWVERLRAGSIAESAHQLSQVAPPWDAGLSTAVVAALRRDPAAGHAVRLLRDHLGLAVHASAVPALQRLAEDATAADHPTLLRDLQAVLRDTRQFHTLHRSISEAFP